MPAAAVVSPRYGPLRHPAATPALPGSTLDHYGCYGKTSAISHKDRGSKRGRDSVRGCRSRDGSREENGAKTRKTSPRQTGLYPLPDVRLPKLSLRDIQAIVINLERRSDRMADCAARLREHCPWLRYRRFDATDGRRDFICADKVASSWHTGQNVVYQKLRSKRKGWDDLHTYVERELELSPGERGCALSHVRAWQECLEQSGSSSSRPLLVLEDDAAPTPDFTLLLARAAQAVPADADILYLGYSQAAEWRRDVSQEIVESEYVWTTVGYLVWPSGARKMLSRLPVDQPVDNWMAHMNATGTLKSYCMRPKIVRQSDCWNVNSDVGHSDEQYWGADSDIKHSDDFYWGPGDIAREDA